MPWEILVDLRLKDGKLTVSWFNQGERAANLTDLWRSAFRPFAEPGSELTRGKWTGDRDIIQSVTRKVCNGQRKRSTAASAFAHVVAAVTLASTWVKRPRLPARFWVLGAACAMGPDLDVVGNWMGIPYEHMLGHRGLTHSLPFAAIMSALVVRFGFSGPEWVRVRPQLLSYFFVAPLPMGCSMP